MLEPFEVDHRQHLLHRGFDLGVFLFLHPQPERDVFVHVHMREQRVTLEDGVDPPFVCRQIVDAHTIKKNIAAVGRNKAADDPQCRGFAAPGWAQQRHELPVFDTEIEIVQHLFAVKRNRDVFQ